MSRKIVYLFIATLLMMSCNNDRSKDKYKTSYKTCDELTVELYTVFGSGAFGGDLLSSYLTDSINFRKFIGTFDSSNETFVYKCEKDTVKVIKVLFEGKKRKSIEVRAFSLKDLKSSKNFE